MPHINHITTSDQAKSKSVGNGGGRGEYYPPNKHTPITGTKQSIQNSLSHPNPFTHDSFSYYGYLTWYVLYIFWKHVSSQNVELSKMAW